MAPPLMPATLTLLLAVSARKPPHGEQARRGGDSRSDRSPAKARHEAAAGSPWAAPFEHR